MAGQRFVPWRVLVFSGMLCLSVCTGSEQQPAPSPLAAVITRGPVTIVPDGRLSEPCYRTAPSMAAEFHADGGKAAVGTHAWLFCDDTFLYVGVRCAEPKLDKLIAPKKQRDEMIWGDDEVELFIETDARAKEYVQIMINPAGSVLDQRIADNQHDRSWNGVAASAGSIGADCWTVECKVRRAALNLRPEQGVAVRGNLSRARRTEGLECINWSMPLRAFHNIERWGYLVIGNLGEHLTALSGPLSDADALSALAARVRALDSPTVNDAWTAYEERAKPVETALASVTNGSTYTVKRRQVEAALVAYEKVKWAVRFEDLCARAEKGLAPIQGEQE